MSSVNNSKLSAAARAKEIVDDFNGWVAAREAAGDWPSYVNHHGKLNRTKMAAEVGFPTSCIRSNSALNMAVATLEARLASFGLLKTSKLANKSIDAATDDLLIQRLMAAKLAAEARSKELEEKLATLKVLLHEQNEKLRTYDHLDEHLAATGRLLRP